jgi:tetratricopeptide (TPR) repeat protein
MPIADDWDVPGVAAKLRDVSAAAINKILVSTDPSILLVRAFIKRNYFVIQVYYVSRVVTVAALSMLIAAAVYSIRLAMADAAFRKETPEGVARALQILPDRANYLLLRALQLDYDGADSTALLERAARVNPLSSAPRIRLGLAAETRGDFQKAETWLLDAAQVDHQFEPRWTLANFYFRRERWDEFWKWMRAALENSYGDRRLAFDLCWRVSQDSDEVLSRAIPDQHDVLAAYLYYVMDQHREATGSVALKLAALQNAADVPLLESACDVLVESGKVVEARELWKQLGHRQTALITNGDFSAEPGGHGFDWRFAHAPGVTDISLPGAHRILFSGKQPESCELLRQFVVLEAGKRYSMRWEARTRGLGSPTGVEWRAGTARGEVESADDWRGGGADFTAGAVLTPIALAYQRPAGEARAEGSVEIRNVVLVERR